MMKKILVTGGSGFIGSMLCERLLEQGYGVVNIDNFNDYYDPSIKWRNIARAWLQSDYTLIVADIRDAVAMEEMFRHIHIDAVVHLAALAGVRGSIQFPLEYADVDITGTVNLLEGARKYGVGKFIFASSSSVYGNQPIPFREDAPLGVQLSPYAAAKLAGEQFCRTWNHLYGLQTICLRFFTVYGERQRPEMAIHRLTRQIDEGGEVQIYGDGSSFRDYTYVGDIVNGIVSAIELPCGYEVVNLGASNEIRLAKLVETIGRKLDKTPNVRFMEEQQGDVACTKASLEKAERLLDYKPQTTFEDGLDRFLNWYNSYKQAFGSN